MNSKLTFVVLVLFGATIQCKDNSSIPLEKNSQKKNLSAESSKDTVLTYNRKKSEDLMIYMFKKQDFEAGSKFTNQEIKQCIVQLTTNRSVTKPELPKLLLITGVLFNDIGNEEKAKWYYELEIEMADLALQTELEEALKQNWRRSKLEALMLLNKNEELKRFKKDELAKLKGEYYQEFLVFFSLRPEDIYASYSLTEHLDPTVGVVRI